MMYLLIAYFLRNIHSKTYEQSDSYVRIIARQSSDIILRHSVLLLEWRKISLSEVERVFFRGTVNRTFIAV